MHAVTLGHILAKVGHNNRNLALLTLLQLLRSSHRSRQVVSINVSYDYIVEIQPTIAVGIEANDDVTLVGKVVQRHSLCLPCAFFVLAVINSHVVHLGYRSVRLLHFHLHCHLCAGLTTVTVVQFQVVCTVRGNLACSQQCAVFASFEHSNARCAVFRHDPADR